MTKYPTIGLSIPDKDLLEAAKAKAKAERRSLSNYICGLLEQDLVDALKEADERQGAASTPAPAPVSLKKPNSTAEAVRDLYFSKKRKPSSARPASKKSPVVKHPGIAEHAKP